MKLPKIAWISLGVLFALASIAIHYEVKIGLHQSHGGSVREMGNVKDGQPAPDFSLPDLSGNFVTLRLVSGTESCLDGFLGHLVRTVPDGDARFAGFAG